MSARLAGLLLMCGCASAPTPSPAPWIPDRPTPVDDSEWRSQNPLDESAFVRLVEATNLRLLAAHQDVEAAAARGLQAGLAANPTLFAGWEEAPFRKPGQGKAALGIAMPFALGGRREAAVGVTDREREWFRARLAELRVGLVEGARSALYAWAHAKERLALERELRVIAESFRETVAKRRSEKSVLEIDLIRTAVERAHQENAVDSTEAEVRMAAARLRAYTGLPDFDVSRIRVELPAGVTLKPLAELEPGLASHPAMRAAEAAVDVARAQQDLASRSAWGDLEVSAAFGRSAGADSSERESIFELGVSVPLPIFDRQQGRSAEAEILRRKSEIERDQVRQELQARLRETHAGVERQARRVARLRDEILPQAAAAVEQASVLYREGKALVLDVLDAQRVLGANRRELLEARRALAEAIATLESLTGGRP